MGYIYRLFADQSSSLCSDMIFSQSLLHPPRSRLNILIARAALRLFCFPHPKGTQGTPAKAGFCSWFRGEQRGGAWPGEWSAMDLISESCKRYWVLGSHSIGYKWVKSDLPPQGLGQQRFWLCCKFSHSPFMLCTITANKGLSWPHRMIVLISQLPQSDSWRFWIDRPEPIWIHLGPGMIDSWLIPQIGIYSNWIQSGFI